MPGDSPKLVIVALVCFFPVVVTTLDALAKIDPDQHKLMTDAIRDTRLNGRSMGELADAVLLNHPTLTKMIDRMVSDALVYRVQDPKDRRKVLMFVSDRGKALCRRLNSLAVSQEEHIVESYGDKSTNELKRLLESLIGTAN